MADNKPSVSLDRMIQPVLLLHIYKKPSHGYELIQNFNSFDPADLVEPATIYRNLRRMENEGLIQSRWETSESGPARRQYQITDTGLEALKDTVIRLGQHKNQIEDFIKTYQALTKRGRANP